MSVQLPPAVRKEVAKLPATTRDVVAQRLRDPPAPPVVYEEAVRLLAELRDIDTTQRAYIAADGLAVWGRLHQDNRAILEAQKLKAHALRQMFICAKMLGDPYKVLQERRIWTDKARKAEQLASFDHEKEIDRVGDKIAIQGRPEFLVSRIADESPLAKKQRAAAKREQEAGERRWREQLKRKAEQEADPEYQFKTHVLDALTEVLGDLREVETFDLSSASAANLRQMRRLVIDVSEAVDRLDALCAPRQVKK